MDSPFTAPAKRIYALIRCRPEEQQKNFFPTE
jgi:hypothetical protein